MFQPHRPRRSGHPGPAFLPAFTQSSPLIARLISALWALSLLLVSPLIAGASSTAEITTLASFADAYMAWDLPTARALFAPDAEIYHDFGDGRVSRVHGAVRRDDWLSARAFVHPLRWTTAGSSGIVLHHLFARTNEALDEPEWYESPLFLSADLSPDGTIVRLYAAYAPEGLNHAIAAAALAATGITTDPPGLHAGAPIIYAETLTAPPAASTSQPSALLTSIRIGPERGDCSWIVAAAITIMALAT